MAIEREELKKMTLAAANAEEVMEIVRAAGEEITAEEAAQLFEKAQAKKTDGQGTLPGRAGGRFRRRGPQLGNRRLCGNRGIPQLVRQQ